jgi:hypothetical protein
MRKFSIVAILFFVIIVSGCNGVLIKNTDGSGNLSGNKPPIVNIEMDGVKHETKLGSYCWESNGKAECVDTAGPVELLADDEPIQIKSGEQITLTMDYTPKPNEIHLSQIKNNEEIEIEIKDQKFTAPDEKGIYYYSYGVWWMDEKEENVSLGDAFYAFVLEVK